MSTFSHEKLTWKKNLVLWAYFRANMVRHIGREIQVPPFLDSIDHFKHFCYHHSHNESQHLWMHCSLTPCSFRVLPKCFSKFHHFLINKCIFCKYHFGFWAHFAATMTGRIGRKIHLASLLNSIYHSLDLSYHLFLL